MVKKVLIMILACSMLLSGDAMAIRQLEKGVDLSSTVKKIVYKDKIAQGDISDWDVVIKNALTWHTEKVKDETVVAVGDIGPSWDNTMMMPKIKEDLVDYTVTAQMTFNPGSSSNIIFRCAAPNQFYSLSIFANGGAFEVGFFKRYNVHQHAQTVLTKKNIAGNTGEKYTVSVEVSGATMTSYINGEVIDTYTDTVNVIEKGGAGLLHFNGNTYFHNFMIESSGGGTSMEAPKIDNPRQETVVDNKTHLLYTVDEIATFSDALYDYYGWDDGITGTFALNNNILSLTPQNDKNNPIYNVIGYARREFMNEDISFKLQLTSSPEEFKKGFGISVRSSQPQILNSDGADGYLVEINNDKLYLKKWIQGKCTVLQEVDNDIFVPGKWYEFNIKTNGGLEGVNISVTIDNKNIFQVNDTNLPIAKGGYVNFHSFQDKLEISNLDTVKPSVKQALGPVVAIGNGRNKAYADGKVAAVGAPYYNAEELMVPLRFMCESLGGTVSWNEKYKTAEVRIGSDIVEITDEFSEYLSNGELNNMKIPAVTKDDIMFVSLTAIENLFDKIVHKTDDVYFLLEKDSNINFTENKNMLNKIINLID